MREFRLVEREKKSEEGERSERNTGKRKKKRKRGKKKGKKENLNQIWHRKRDTETRRKERKHEIEIAKIKASTVGSSDLLMIGN